MKLTVKDRLNVTLVQVKTSTAQLLQRYCTMQPFKVTQGHPLLCQLTGIYDFLLALNSTLTSIFSCSGDIMPHLHVHTSPLYRVKLEKEGWE